MNNKNMIVLIQGKKGEKRDMQNYVFSTEADLNS